MLEVFRALSLCSFQDCAPCGQVQNVIAAAFRQPGLLPLTDLNTQFHEYVRFRGSKNPGKLSSANSDSANEIMAAYWLHGHSGAALCAAVNALCKSRLE